MAKRPVTKTKVTKATKIAPTKTYLERIEEEIKTNNSPFSMILGILIVIVVGVLVFNYFNQKETDIAPTGVTTQVDVTPDKLPGKYTVKDGDTLFTIAENYYKDGNKFTEIAKANNMSDVNSIQTGQVIEIPKVEAVAEASVAPEASANPSPAAVADETSTGIGGGDTTVWGPKITTDTYTVQEGDWLSTIAARTYGDIYAYQKIAAANNISDPNIIEPGQVLKLPR